MSDLKRCPKCEADCDFLTDVCRQLDIHWSVVCPRCEKCGPCAYSKEKAVAAWNALPRMSEMQAKLATLRARVAELEAQLAEKPAKPRVKLPITVPGLPHMCDEDVAHEWIVASDRLLEEIRMALTAQGFEVEP